MTLKALAPEPAITTFGEPVSSRKPNPTFLIVNSCTDARYIFSIPKLKITILLSISFSDES